MEHRTVSVKAIHANPHRDFDRNPINEDQVEKLIESIDRTGFWENIVVRPHPTRKGQYELAYGHSRLEAVKRSKIVEVTVPVTDLSDWDMYLAMKDENETQQSITPAIAFENVEVGIHLLESGFNKIGPKGTEEELNEVLGRNLVVPRGTTKSHGGHAFEQVRNAYHKGEGIGRCFLDEYIPSGKIHQDVLSEVTTNYYGRKRQEAAEKEALAKDKEAEAKQKEAEAEKDKEEAARLREEANEAVLEAEKLRKEAEKIGNKVVSPDILMHFAHTRTMAAFAKAIESIGIPQKLHHVAMEYALDNEFGVRTMSRELGVWWYEASGQGRRDRERILQDEAMERFRKTIHDGDFGQYLMDLTAKARELTRCIKIALTAARYYENGDHRNKARMGLLELQAQLDQLIAHLGGSMPPDDEEESKSVPKLVNPQE